MCSAEHLRKKLSRKAVACISTCCFLTFETFTEQLACWKEELEEVAAVVVSGLMLVVAASGSGFSWVPEVGPGLSCAVAASPGSPMVTAVVAASGLGFVDPLSGALLLATGLLPTPEVFVLPRGFGWIGDEQKARQQNPCCATKFPANGFHVRELKITASGPKTDREGSVVMIMQAVHQALKSINVQAHLQRLGAVIGAALPACLEDAGCEIED